MYIKKLKKWDDSDWELMFDNGNIEFVNREEVKQILTLPTKISIENNFERLYELGVINGIGANWMGKFCIWLITFLFPGVRYEWHDINYLIGGNNKEKNKSDYGLLKYSMITVADNFNKLSSMEILFVFKEMFIILYIPLSFLKIIILLFMWRLLGYFGGKAFYYHTSFKAG